MQGVKIAQACRRHVSWRRHVHARAASRGDLDDQHRIEDANRGAQVIRFAHRNRLVVSLGAPGTDHSTHLDLLGPLIVSQPSQESENQAPASARVKNG